MSFAGSSPRWKQVEARLCAPVSLPSLRLIRTVNSPDKVQCLEQFLAGGISVTYARGNGLQSFSYVEHGRLTAREIIKAVAEKHGLTVNDILCHSRHRALVRARQEAGYEIARLTELSYPQIGRALGGRDHTTILHCIRAHAQHNGLPLLRKLTPSKSTPAD